MSALGDRVLIHNNRKVFPYPCVILCGGASRRMGVDKAHLPFGTSQTLMEYQYRKLKPLFTETYLSCKEFGHVSFKAKVIVDQSDIFAPTVALKSAFEALESEYLFCIPVDTPFVNQETVSLLIAEKGQNNDAVIASSPSGAHHLVGLFRKSILPVIDAMHRSDLYKVGYLLKQIRTRKVTFSSDNPFVNLNHPREYADALRRV